LRANIKETISNLGDRVKALLSGDNRSEEGVMRSLFGNKVDLHFNQNPHQKLAVIQNLQQQGHQVLMLGDGLNDAGALQQSQVGIAVSDSSGVFTPGSDGILEGDKLQYLDRFLKLAKQSTVILKAAFAISFCYNAIALGFAVTGHLTPLVAAILMPISSISVVSFSSLAVKYSAHKTFNTKA